MTRFFSIEHSAGGRSYTYSCDDEALLLYRGDTVETETRHGPTRGFIVAEVAEPPFPTKPILRLLKTAADRAAREAAENSEEKDQ